MLCRNCYLTCLTQMYIAIDLMGHTHVALSLPKIVACHGCIRLVDAVYRVLAVQLA